MRRPVQDHIGCVVHFVVGVETTGIISYAAGVDAGARDGEFRILKLPDWEEQTYYCPDYAYFESPENRSSFECLSPENHSIQVNSVKAALADRGVAALSWHDASVITEFIKELVANG